MATKFAVNGTASLSACPTYSVAFTMSRADSNVLKLRSHSNRPVENMSTAD